MNGEVGLTGIDYMVIVLGLLFVSMLIGVSMFSGRKRTTDDSEWRCGCPPEGEEGTRGVEDGSKICLQCGKKFSSAQKTAKYCSKKCRDEALSASFSSECDAEDDKDARVPQGTEVKPMVYRLAFHGKPTLLAEWEYRGCKCYVMSLDICPSIAVAFPKENSFTRLYKEWHDEVDAVMSEHGFSTIRNCSDAILKDAGIKIPQVIDSLVGWTYDRKDTDLVGMEVYDTDPVRIAKRGKRKTWTTEECMSDAYDVVDIVLDLIQKHENYEQE